jgi:hypothetical protein
MVHIFKSVHYIVCTVVHICIGIHSVSIVIQICLPNCFVINHCGLSVSLFIILKMDVFQVFGSCSSVTHKQHHLNIHTSTRFAPDSGLSYGFSRPFAIIIAKPAYMEPISLNWDEEGILYIRYKYTISLNF